MQKFVEVELLNLPLERTKDLYLDGNNFMDGLLTTLFKSKPISRQEGRQFVQ